MKRVLRAVKDTYITNRIIRDKFRATDSNVGQAGTLDLFKLAGESNISFVTASFESGEFIPGDGPFISGTSEPIEISRILIKFDLDPLRALTASVLDLSDARVASTFSCVLKLSDVLGGQPLPSNYSIVLYPLSRSFDEGYGRDVYSFEDIDATNFITASVSSGVPVTWSQAFAQLETSNGSGSTTVVGGASHLGFNGEQFIDAITGSTALGDLFVVKAFADDRGDDLVIDVTKIISATLAGLIVDHGFRISFSGTQETDDRTRFVKRFASRHSTNTRVRPKIEVGFDDSTQDNHENFYFDTSGSLFLNNYARGFPTNIINPRTGQQVTGSNSLLLTLTSGSSAMGTLSQFTVTASQHQVGQNFVTGVYVANFAIGSFRPEALRVEVANAQSATFIEAWGSFPSVRSGTFNDTLGGILTGPTGSFTGTLIGAMSGDFQAGTGSFSDSVFIFGTSSNPFLGNINGDLGGNFYGTSSIVDVFEGLFLGNLTGSMSGLFSGMGLFATGSVTGSFTGSFDGEFTGSFTGTLDGPNAEFTGSFTGSSDGLFTGSIFGALTGSSSVITGSLFSGFTNGAFIGMFAGTLTGSFVGVFSGTIYEGTHGYHTGSLIVYNFNRTAFSNVQSKLKINITNMRNAFRTTEKTRFRVFVQDDGFKLRLVKRPIESKSIIFDKMYYRIRDVNSDDVMFDFDIINDSTRMSTDSSGMYFDVYMSDLDVGRVYSIDVLIEINGSMQIFENVGGSFRIDP